MGFGIDEIGEQYIMIQFVPILQTIEENGQFADNPVCKDVLSATIDYYKVIGFNKPWIGYFVLLHDQLVGSAGYKGKPIGNKIEIAYGTNTKFQHQGIGTQICHELVRLALASNPQLDVMARTLPDNLYSISVLKRNGFALSGIVHDKDDGDVLEWRYPGNNT